MNTRWCFSRCQRNQMNFFWPTRFLHRYRVKMWKNLQSVRWWRDDQFQPCNKLVPSRALFPNPERATSTQFKKHFHMFFHSCSLQVHWCAHRWHDPRILHHSRSSGLPQDINTSTTSWTLYFPYIVWFTHRKYYFIDEDKMVPSKYFEFIFVIKNTSHTLVTTYKIHYWKFVFLFVFWHNYDLSLFAVTAHTKTFFVFV